MIQFADAFNTYGPSGTAAYTTMVDGAWAQVVNHCLLQTDPDGVSTQLVFYAPPNADSGRTNFARIVCPTARPTIGVSARYWTTYLPESSTQEPYLAMFCDVDNNIHAYVSILSAGAIAIYTRVGEAFGGQYDKTAYTPGPVVTAGSWWHVECKAVVSGSYGMTITVKVEGKTVVATSFTSTHLINGNIAQLRFGTNSNSVLTGPGLYMKDLVIWDDQGSQNNDFLGRVKVYNLIPNGDNTLTMSIVGGQTYGFNVLDNNPPDSGKYLLSNVADIGNWNKFTMTDLPTTVSSVKGVVSYVRVGKSDSGDGSFQAGIVSAVSSYAGNNNAISASQTYWFDTFELDPDTTSPWTRSAINAAMQEFKRTS